jgi:very-short-patch-repair endonuclease
MAENPGSESPLPLREGVRGRGKSKSTLRSRALRRQSTEAEKKLWQKLRRKQFHGLRFRRQYPLGPYFADFVCLPARLVVEVDGATHTELEQAEHDQRRTQWLVSQRFRILRFWNSDVFENVDGVVERIGAEVREHPLPLTPSREGRGK